MNRSKRFKIIHFCAFILAYSISVATSPSAVAANQPAASISVTLVCAQQRQFVSSPVTRDAQIQWMVAGIPGGNAQVGKISSSGLYTAPKLAPASPVEITAVDKSTMRTLVTASVSVVEDPAVTEAHEQWLEGAEAAAREHGCTGEIVKQLPDESVDDAIKLYAQVANDRTCLILQPVSVKAGSQRYSFASGGEINGVSILYISDVSQMRIWNGVEVTEE